MVTIADNEVIEQTDDHSDLEVVVDETKEKLDEAMNQNIVLQREMEIIKSRARVMLEQKDVEIERLKM